MTDTNARMRYAQSAPPRRPSRLDRIPGYRGYHEKEARRDADGTLRRMLAQDYAEQHTRLTRVQQTLLAARRLDQLAPVDQAAGRLNHFIDRLRTATYGYAGLRDSVQVDERALDQLYQFDFALADGVDEVGAKVEAIEQAAEGDGDLHAPLAALDSTVRDLQERFNARADVFQTGQPTANTKLFDVVNAPPMLPTTASEPLPLLNLNDAASVDGQDWIVAARTRVDGPTPWTDYLLRDGEMTKWLIVPGDPSRPLALTEQVDFWTRVPPVTPLIFGGVTYSLVEQQSGTGTITGAAGERTGTVNAYVYSGVDGAYLVLRDWGSDRQALVGRTIQRNDVEFYPRQG
ncbi:MAG: DUF4178 domain-containing protein [Thermomicrobia bacterium]|nr:DUF4178 domain-containing protein [Thermomicrobia bacterium]MCA1725188.1 DUF4178 domain-containing protein [Thermomicrobia bacterium]